VRLRACVAASARSLHRCAAVAAAPRRRMLQRLLAFTQEQARV